MKTKKDSIMEYIPLEVINNNKRQMNNAYKRHLISAFTTFISTFLVSMSLAITSESFTFSKEAILSIAVSAIVAGVRGIAKLIIEWNTGKIS